MPKKIRVTVEMFNPNNSTEYEDLPDGWDDWTEARRYSYLVSLAVSAQDCHVSSGAEVVDVDENRREV